MTYTDPQGHALSGASRASADDYAQALTLFHCYRNDPVATLDRAIARDPQFAMAHIMRAWLLLLSTEPALAAAARDALAAQVALPMDARERAHFDAATALAAGRWTEAARALEDVTIAHPRDVLALQVGHQLDFFTGQSRMLRDRIARALPAWSDDTPGYHALLGMHAFGLEEMGQYAQAEESARQAIERERQDAWAWHAFAHSLEMQGRSADGAVWLRSDTAAWSDNSFFAVHNWWHLALFELEQGNTGEALRLYDGPVLGDSSTQALNLIDASAMLWRLELAGVDVGGRWASLAQRWIPLVAAAHYAFNDFHALLAFAKAGREDLVEQVMGSYEVAMRSPGDNARFASMAGRPLSVGVLAYAQGDMPTAIDTLRGVRNRAAIFGGSHAQRDLIDVTLIAAARRTGDSALASALIAERRWRGQPGFVAQRAGLDGRSAQAALRAA